uniref:CAP-Gly domain-containing protein n=1 Tax=Meloidogyne javanica TaxID=6303 RepID=A0A915MRX8_MELJA
MGVIDNSIIHVNDVSQKLSSLIPQDSNTSNVEHYVGKRCIVRTSGQKPRFAKIAYIGPTSFDAKQEAIRPNNWVGVIYENPEGKNDGSLDGKRYFTCRPNYGGFVLPTSIEVLEEDGHFVNDQSDNDQIEEI